MPVLKMLQKEEIDIRLDPDGKHVHVAFFANGENFGEDTRMSEAPLFALIPPAFTAVASFALFIYPSIVLDLAKMTAKAMIGPQ